MTGPAVVLGLNADLLDDKHGADYLTKAEHTDIGTGTPHHAPVTLDTNADTLLSLSTQALGLDAQDANHVLVGPALGTAAVPTFRQISIKELSDVNPAMRPAGDNILQFIDGAWTNGILVYPAPADTSPAMDGTADPGDGVTYSRADHVHPSDTSRVPAFAAQAKNTVFSGPATGSDAVPTFRALANDDVPTLDHGAKLTGLSDDDHAQYSLLAGRTGGQIFKGGTQPSDALTLVGTAGVGDTYAPMIVFKTGTNGGTLIADMTNNGVFQVFNPANVAQYFNIYHDGIAHIDAVGSYYVACSGDFSLTNNGWVFYHAATVGITDATTTLVVTPVATSGVPLVARGRVSQTGNLQQWQDSNWNVLAYVDKSGGAVFNESGADADFRVESDTEANMLFLDADGGTDGYLYLGGTTNGIRIEKGGNLTLLGTATQWDDLRIEPVARTTGANAPSFEKWLDDAAGTSRGVYLYSFDDANAGSEKEIFFTMQLPHAWNGGDISFHVHWIGSHADTTSTPRWGLEYDWKEIGEVFGDTTIVYATGNTYPGGTDTDITALKHYITEFTDLAPGSTADGLSSILIGRLFRDSANAADTYNVANNKCGLLYIDAHYQINSFGSNLEYTK